MAALETLTLDGLSLNSTTLRLESVDLTPPPELEEWVKGADADGALLARFPRCDNRVIEAQVRVVQTSTMDLALAQIALITDKLQETKYNTNGLALVWTPADATKTVTFRCLSGQIIGLPINAQDSGWFQRSPIITIRMTCLPFGEGAEVLAGSVTADTNPMQTVTVTGVAGDVPAIGRLVVTDAATQSRRWVAWGMESRWLPTSSAPSLLLDSTSMVTSGFMGTTATRSGAYSGASNNVISATLLTPLQAICGLGNLSHVGNFRVHLRFYASSINIALRLTWQALDGPFTSLPFKAPVTVGWNHMDLGLITIPVTALGTQRWTGRIEAYSTSTPGDTFAVDVMELMPAEAYGRARASYAYATGLVVGYDDFTSTTSGAALNARTAPLGGSWATSGTATDLTFADAPISTDETVTRATTSDTGDGRFAILGSTNYTDTEVGMNFYMATYNPTAGGLSRVIARWVDSSNWLQVQVPFASIGGITVVQNIATVKTTLATSSSVGLPLATWYGLRIVVAASGIFHVMLINVSNGSVLTSVDGYSSTLATGGVLATGKPGFNDVNLSALPTTRYYDQVYAATPATEPIALYSGRSIEFRHDTTLRKDSTGTYAGPPPEYVGSRFFVPNSGGATRSARVAVIARRNDVETATDDFVADSTTVQVYTTPRYINPR